MAPASVERCVGEFRASLTRGALPSSECVSFGVSKGLSLGIVAGAVLVKVPQINRIVAKGSAKGLRVSMFRSEVLSGTVAIAYFARSGIALAAYAELFFILLQNLVILALIRRYGDGPAKNAKNANESRVSFAVAFAAHAATVALLAFGVLANVPDSALETLYNCTTAVLIAGRAPQIAANFRVKSTGELSLASQALKLSQLTRSLREAPDTAGHYYARACSLLTMRMFSEAVHDADACLRLQPKFAKARFAKGRALYFLGARARAADNHGHVRPHVPCAR